MNLIVALYVICWLLVPIALAWAFIRWWRSNPRFVMPQWRSRLALAAFVTGGLSVLLWIFLAFWARLRGGFRYYDPILLRCYGIGLILGFTGFISSLPAKGKLRWPACFISGAMVFMWLVAASME